MCLRLHIEMTVKSSAVQPPSLKVTYVLHNTVFIHDILSYIVAASFSDMTHKNIADIALFFCFEN